MLFYTMYQVVGSRCTGTYLVNATTKKEANTIVKAMDRDYVRVRSQTKEAFSEEDWEEIVEGVDVPEHGKASHIESGT